MNRFLYTILLFLWMPGFYGNSVKEPDAIRILETAKSNFKMIIDFTADVEIEINVDFINIPNKTARVIYKYPDKLKFKSKSFIMVPKKGIGFSVFELLESEYSAIYIGSRQIKGRDLNEIKVIPMDDKSDIALATLYIDLEDHLIHYMEATTKKSGFFSTEFEYGKNAPLPESNRIQFDVDEMRLPLKFLGKVNIDNSKIKENSVGEIIIRYSNYIINQGLSDDQFEEEELNE